MYGRVRFVAKVQSACRKTSLVASRTAGLLHLRPRSQPSLWIPSWSYDFGWSLARERAVPAARPGGIGLWMDIGAVAARCLSSVRQSGVLGIN